MNKFFSFFRFFDVAFFILGAFLLYVMKEHRYFNFSNPMPTDKSLGLVELVAMIAISFALGLVCHGVSRIVLNWHPTLRSLRLRNSSGIPFWSQLPKFAIETLKRFRSFPSNCFTWEKPPTVWQSWFERLSSEERHELSKYFWYMRATCFNLSVALVLAGLLTFYHSWGWLIASIVAVPVLVFLGLEYGRSMKIAVAQDSAPVNSNLTWSFIVSDADLTSILKIDGAKHE
jgi:hypothetical protein